MAGSNRLTKPLIFVLVVGVASVIAFGLLLGGGVLVSQGQSDTITIGVDGIDGKQYRVGDELDAVVMMQGTTFDCAAPRAAIINTDTPQTVWDSGFSLIVCDPGWQKDGRPVDIVWHLGKSYTENGIISHTAQDSTEEIVLTEAGEHALVVSFAGQEATVPFTVYMKHKPPPPSPAAGDADEPLNLRGSGNEVQDKITVSVSVGGEPLQSEVQSGMGSSLVTRYLPVSITQTINLGGPTDNITIYPVFADWDGIVRANLGTSIVDENGNNVASDGVGLLSLHGVHAVCSEPYPIMLTSDMLADNGLQYVNATEPVSSSIPWGDIVYVSFNKTQSGIIRYTEGYGIAPAGYNDSNDSTYRSNGAGNQEILGEYHLSFTSFYPATAISLPERADAMSFLEAKCTITEDSPHVQISEMPYIYVYDVWFTFGE